MLSSASFFPSPSNVNVVGQLPGPVSLVLLNGSAKCVDVSDVPSWTLSQNNSAPTSDNLKAPLDALARFTYPIDPSSSSTAASSPPLPSFFTAAPCSNKTGSGFWGQVGESTTNPAPDSHSDAFA